MNTNTKNTKSYNKLRSAWIKFLYDQNFTHGLTLQWNRSVGMNSAVDAVKHFHAVVDRKLLGRNFHKKTNRSFAAFIFEGDEHNNLHCHSLWRINSEHIKPFEEFVRADNGGITPWGNIVRSGSFDLQLNCATNGNGLAAATYITKQLQYRSTDRIVFSDSFLPQGQNLGDPIDL